MVILISNPISSGLSVLTMLMCAFGNTAHNSTQQPHNCCSAGVQAATSSIIIWPNWNKLFVVYMWFFFSKCITWRRMIINRSKLVAQKNAFITQPRLFVCFKHMNFKRICKTGKNNIFNPGPGQSMSIHSVWGYSSPLKGQRSCMCRLFQYLCHKMMIFVVLFFSGTINQWSWRVCFGLLCMRITYIFTYIHKYTASQSHTTCTSRKEKLFKCKIDSDINRICWAFKFSPAKLKVLYFFSK